MILNMPLTADATGTPPARAKTLSQPGSGPLAFVALFIQATSGPRASDPLPASDEDKVEAGNHGYPGPLTVCAPTPPFALAMPGQEIGVLASDDVPAPASGVTAGVNEGSPAGRMLQQLASEVQLAAFPGSLASSGPALPAAVSAEQGQLTAPVTTVPDTSSGQVTQPDGPNHGLASRTPSSPPSAAPLAQVPADLAVPGSSEPHTASSAMAMPRVPTSSAPNDSVAGPLRVDKAPQAPQVSQVPRVSQVLNDVAAPAQPPAPQYSREEGLPRPKAEGPRTDYVPSRTSGGAETGVGSKGTSAGTGSRVVTSTMRLAEEDLSAREAPLRRRVVRPSPDTPGLSLEPRVSNPGVQPTARVAHQALPGAQAGSFLQDGASSAEGAFEPSPVRSKEASGGQSDAPSEGHEDRSSRTEPLLTPLPRHLQTGPASAPHAATQARWHPLVRELAGHMRLLAKTGGRELEVRLDVSGIGRVDVTALDNRRDLTLRLVTENDLAQDMIKSNLPELRAALAEQGFRLGSVTVEVGQQGFGPSMSSQGQRGGSGQGPSQGFALWNQRPETTESQKPAAPEPSHSHQLIDYRV